MPRTSRRQFAKALAALPLVAVPGVAQEEKPPSPLAGALLEVVRAQSGQHLDSEELARIEKDLKEWAPAVERLRQFKLTNADEPDFSFSSLTRRW